MLGIYRWSCNWGRMGNLESIFLAESEDVSKCIGNDFYLGEVLGKHSEVRGTLEKEEIKLITNDGGVVAMFHNHGLSTGYDIINNVLERLAEKEPGDE